MKYVNWIVLLLFFCCNTLLSQADLQIQVSRTSGVAPLYVFFDATISSGWTGVNDLANADFSWNFDVTNTDPSGSWEQTKGMVTGHVFEQAGTYTITCTLFAPDGTSDTENLTITVSDFAGTTYYVSNAGNDANDGLSDATAWATGNFALSQLSANERILFRRDDTFIDVDATLNGLNGGPMLIGAYGTGNAPILVSTLGQSHIEILTSEDIRIIDLHLIATGTGGNSRSVRVEDMTVNILLLRLEIEDTGAMAVYQDESNLLGVFDCYMHNCYIIGVYSGDSTRFSWVGNTLNNLIGTPQPEHGMRIQGGEKQFIAHSIFTNLVDTKTGITLRGQDQRHAMVYDNKLDRVLQVNPTNAFTIQAIYDVTLAGNYIGQNVDYVGTNFDPTPGGINIEASRVAIRNNVIDGYWWAIAVRPDRDEVLAANVDIYNNTYNWRSVTPDSGPSGILVFADDSFDVTIRNNYLSAPNLSDVVVFGGSDNTNTIISDNLITDAPLYAGSPLPNSAAHTNDAANYKLTPISPAIDVGANDVPVFFDQEVVIRPIGTNKDVGAFEYAADLPIAVSIILQGAYNTSTGLMNDDLRIANLIPASEPYSTTGFPDLRNSGIAHTANLSITGNDAIVDWVVLELRSTTTNITARRAALLQRDGGVVDIDGISPVAFQGLNPGNYYISLRHRNHLGVMSAGVYDVQP